MEINTFKWITRWKSGILFSALAWFYSLGVFFLHTTNVGVVLKARVSHKGKTKCFLRLFLRINFLHIFWFNFYTELHWKLDKEKVCKTVLQPPGIISISKTSYNPAQTTNVNRKGVKKIIKRRLTPEVYAAVCTNAFAWCHLSCLIIWIYIFQYLYRFIIFAL